MDPYKALATHIEAKEYLAEKEIPQLFESMLTGLMYSRPADPLEYLEECITKTKEAGVENIMWDTFALKKDPLPPIPSTSRQEPNEETEAPLESLNSQPPSSLNPFITLPPIANQSVEVEEEQMVVESSTTGTGFEDSSLPPPPPAYSTDFAGDSSVSFVRESSDPVFISFIGGVGSGHEDWLPTVCKDFGLEILQLGNLIQSEVESFSEVGNEMRTYMELGDEIPDETLLQVMKNAISKIASKVGYVLVGFPTTTQLVQMFESLIGAFSLAVYFEQSDEELQLQIEESTNSELAAEDVKSFRSTTIPLLDHFKSSQILITIESSQNLDGSSNQAQKVKEALCSVGFVAKKESKPKEAEVLKREQVEEEEIVAVEDTTKLGIEDSTLPPGVPEENETALFLSIIGSSTSGIQKCQDHIKEKFGALVLDVGDLMKSEVENETPIGLALKSLMLQFKQIPDDLCVATVLEAVKSCSKESPILLRGFPKSQQQLSSFQNIAGPISVCLAVEQSDDEMRESLKVADSQLDDEMIEQEVADYKSQSEQILKVFETAEKLVQIPTADKMDESVEDTIAKVMSEKLSSCVIDPEKLDTAIKEAEKMAIELNNTVDASELTSVFEKFPVVFVTGGPGSGKGTQCEKIVSSFNFTHLSSGDLLRAKVASGSADGQELDAIMKAGKLVPLEKVLDLITEAMVNAVNSGNCKGFLIDGYPREIDQGIKFEARIKPCSLVIDFDVADEVMVQRLLERGKTSGRLDDNEETIRARLNTYREATVPVAAHYDSQSKLVRIGANRSVEEIFADVKAAFDSKLSIQPKPEMTEAIAKLPVVFVTGGPGSGKGTQCEKIVSSFNFTHLSSGDLLRAKVASGSADGQELDAIMKAGKLVPLEKVLDLITEAMVNAVNSGNCKGFLIDGYPREIDQGIKFEERIKPCSLVIDFDVPDEVMVQRLLERGKTSGRLDDNEETIRARLNTYREATVPVAAHYDSQSKLVRIDANRSVEEIFADVQAAFQSKGIGAAESFSQPIFFIVGGPGSGKGTQCEKMVEEFSFTHLSSGDLLRAEVASGSPKGKELQEEMAAGKLTSTETVLGLMKAAMEKEKAVSKGYLIDGYPRNVEQGQKFEEIVSPCAACISFEVPNQVMKERLMKRGETSGRVDDNEETIQKRLVTFENETKPVLEYYKEQGKLNAIDANRSPDEIYQDVRTVITKFVPSG